MRAEQPGVLTGRLPCRTGGARGRCVWRHLKGPEGAALSPRGQGVVLVRGGGEARSHLCVTQCNAGLSSMAVE